MNAGFEIIERNIKKVIEEDCERIGILCRVFSRSKNIFSLKRKIQKKNEEQNIINEQKYYTKEGKKVQDIIGIRIVTYFYEDVDLLWQHFERKYSVVDKNKSDVKTDKFGVVTKNMVCEMEQKEKEIFYEIQNYDNSDLLSLVDATFEIQFRTIFSEGWHEIEHDLRYKNSNDWKNLDDENRMLNGIYATLETSDRALKSLFDDIAYKHYKQRNWAPMLRVKYRMHLKDFKLSEELENIIDRKGSNIGKLLYKFDRKDLINIISEKNIDISLTLDNIVYIINYIEIHNREIETITPQNIIIDLTNKLPQQTEPCS